MKKKTILAAFATMAIALSANGQTSGGANQLTVKNYQDSLMTKVGEIKCEAHISVDFPTAGNPTLVNNIRTWIFSAVDDKSNPASSNINAITTLYLKNRMEDMKEMAEDTEYALGLNSSLDINKTYESGKFVTFQISGYNYTGGAHGMAYSEGVTFSKKSGKKLGYNMLNMARKTEIRRLIERYLLSYFGMSSIREMKEMLFLPEGTTIVPLPAADPYIENNEMVFLYQQYEIAPYAAGMPEARIPMKVIMPYLSAMFKGL